MGTPLLKGASDPSHIPRWDQTARPTHGGAEAVTTVSQASGVATVDVAAGNYQVLGTVNANITSWVFNNYPASGGVCLTLMLPMGATLRTVAAFGGTLIWMTAQPTHVVNKWTVYNMVTLDQGTTWFIWASVQP